MDSKTLGMLIPLVSVVSALSFTLLERIRPYRKGLPIFREGYWTDLVWYTLIQSAFLSVLILNMIIPAAESYFQLSPEGYLSHWPVWALWLLFLLTHDFYMYWFHRLQHHSKVLWRTHEAHHSVQEVDFLAGGRSHVLEIIINQTIEFAPIFFLLDAEKAGQVAALKAMTDSTYGMFIHANLDIRLGWLGYIFNGPHMHQWHHAEHKEVYYANYSTKFAFFDWIFGTYFNPNYTPKVWGLPYDFPKDYFAQHVFAFYRFDVKWLESQKWYQDYDNVRVNALNWIRQKFGSKPIEPGYIRAPETHGEDPA